MSKKITVVCINHQCTSDLPDVLRQIKNTFSIPVSGKEDTINLAPFWDQSRKQFHSTSILKVLETSFNDADNTILGVLNVDLYIPILTYVFGEAYLNGRCAVVSTFRLRNEYYGLIPDRKLTGQRLVKECIHELGHCFGLKHCRDFNCVMHSANIVEEIDIRPHTFCDTCRLELKEYLRP